jgi:glycosyltransferase involved in cell wall biosynthesis
VPPEKITVVLNGIDVDRFDKARKEFNRAEFLRSWGLPDEGFLVGTVGELKALKGHEEFVRAAKQILYEFKNAYFIIAGVDTSRNGENRTALNRLIEQLNLVDHVRIVGALEDVAPLLCSLDVFVSASRIESFGLAIAEAMACGVAVVATETAGAREILGQSETGLLVPVGNAEALATAVRALLNDEDRRRSLGNAGCKAVSEHFSLDRMVEITERIYCESMTRSRRMAG